MAEVVGLMASIVSLIEVTAKLGTTCKHYIDSIRDAENLFRDIDQTTSSLRILFEDMKKLGDLRLHESRSLGRVLAPEGDMKACEDVILRLEKIINERLNALCSPTPGKRGYLSSRLARWDSSWIKQARELTQQMERYRSSINQALQLELNLSTRTPVPPPEPLWHRYHENSVTCGHTRNNDSTTHSRHSVVADWLAPRNYADDQKLYIGRRAVGTCAWLLQSQEYRAWLQEKGSMLFCHGVPGAGKTFTAAAVIEHLGQRIRQAPDLKLGLAYLYFHYRDPGPDHQAICLLRNLLGQLTRSLPDTAETLEPLGFVQKLYDAHGQRYSVTQPTLDDVTESLYHVADWYDQVFIVVDALDECHDSGECDKFLFRLRGMQSKLDVRIFVTSRFSADKHGIINKHGITERRFSSLEIRASKEDLRKFLHGGTASLGDVIKDDPDLREEVKNGITDKVDGVFLLAEMYMRHLKDLPTATEVRERIRSIHTGQSHDESLDLAYDDILLRINGLKSGSLKSLAKRALIWVTFATRDLTEMELRHALALKPEMNSLAAGDYPSLDKVTKACFGLLDINPKSHIVRLAHNTTKQYLERARHTWLAGAHKEIAEDCITYLCLDEFSRGPFPDTSWFSLGELDTVLKSRPLISYASSNWAYHLSEAGKYDQPRLLCKLCNRPENLRLSFQIHLVASRQRFPEGIRTVHIVSNLGSPNLVRTLSQRRLLERDARDSGGKTALHWAVARKDGGMAQLVVQELLDLKFEINAVDIEGRTPLHVAAKLGHVETVEFLLRKKADTEMGSGSITPLVEACCCGHVGVVEALLAGGAKVNVKSRLGTPLGAAILAASEECVAAILKSKRVKKHESTEFGTALHDAAYRGSPGLVRMLLDAGFDPNRQGPHGTPLQVAIAGDHNIGQARDTAEVIRLLLDRGADVNVHNKFGTALDSALDYGSKDLERLLRGHGAVEANMPRKTVQDAATQGSSPLTPDLGPVKSQLLPEVLRNRFRQVIVAIMMDNDKLVQKETRTIVAAFRQAIKERNIRSIKVMSQFAMLVFEAMIDLVKYDVESKEGTKNRVPTTNHLPNFLVAGVARAASILGWSVDFALGVNRSKQNKITDSLHAANTASSSLELITAAAVQILSDAIEFGDEEIVQMLARYWVSCLRKIFFPGKASDKMMETLVHSRAEEFERAFRDNDSDKTMTLARVGLELMSVAIQGRGEDDRLTQLAMVLAKIWSLAIHNSVGKGYGSYEQLEWFMWRNGEKMRAGCETGNWQTYKRLGISCTEILIQIVADGDALVAHIKAQSIARDWQFAIDCGGGTQIVDNVFFQHMEDQVWEARDGMATSENNSKPESLLRTRLYHVVGTLLTLLHVTVKCGNELHGVTERFSDLVLRNLERLQTRGRAVGEAARRQLLKFIPVWCEIDSTPVHYLETLITLHSISRRAGPTVEAAACREIVTILSKPSDELNVLKRAISDAVSSSDRPDNVARIKSSIRRLEASLGENNLLT
ncbi:hypothetical protein DL768_007859 [Monosporascus sp. mg162]|nr:hypothetical protein DL768_007859 [Monosporascus sp. mg162]